MSNSAQTLSGKRIESLLDDNSFVEVGSYVTARNTDFNMTADRSAKCTLKKFPAFIKWR